MVTCSDRILGKEKTLDNFIKCTIVEARYGGAYEGAEYLAFPCNDNELPEGWDGDDITCHDFWFYNKDPVGKGSTAKEAKEDLVVQLQGQQWD